MTGIEDNDTSVAFCAASGVPGGGEIPMYWVAPMLSDTPATSQRQNNNTNQKGGNDFGSSK